MTFRRFLARVHIVVSIWLEGYKPRNQFHFFLEKMYRQKFIKNNKKIPLHFSINKITLNYNSRCRLKKVHSKHKEATPLTFG